MDENEFLRGIEGEQYGDQDLISGAEHLIRLKKQVGMTRPNDSLELEKDAGFKDVLEGAKSGIKYQGMGAGAGLKGMSMPGARARSAGMLAGMAAPAAAVGGAAYLAGKHGKEKEASPLQDILNNARTKTAATHQDLPHAYQSVKNTIKGYLANHPTARAAAIGGATSGAVGAALGAASSPGDRINGAISGGVSGATIGAGASALHHHLSHKLASARQKTASSIVEHLKDVNPGLVAATGVGALLGGVGTYLSSRPQADTGKSRAEEELEGKIEAQKSQPERGLMSKMHHRNTELEHGYAQAFREHPNKAAVLGTITGAMGGYGIGRLAGGLSKLRGGK